MSPPLRFTPEELARYLAMVMVVDADGWATITLSPAEVAPLLAYRREAAHAS